MDVTKIVLYAAICLIGSASRMGWSQTAPMAATAQKAQQHVSIGDTLRNRGTAPVHIIYVHGIGATGPNGSGTLRDAICNYPKVNGCIGQAVMKLRERPDSGIFAPGSDAPEFNYWGHKIWQNPEEWSAAAPFVDHWEITRNNGQKVLLDEINWWPLTWALKCRDMIRNEASLAGPAATYLNLCSMTLHDDNNSSKPFQFFHWIDPTEAKALEAMPTKGAFINRGIKNNLLDWGFSEATLAVGPMQDVVLEGIRQLLEKSVALYNREGAVGGSGANTEFLIVTHSLGSYLMFAALKIADWETGAPSCDCGSSTRQETFSFVLSHTSQVYFFANQIPLLELATLKGKLGTAATLQKWSELRTEHIMATTGAAPTPAMAPQVVAWSDPSDLLTWHVPPVEGVHVLNFEVRNAHHIFWVVERPTPAHDNYPLRRDVLKSLLDPKQTTPTTP